MLTSGSSGGAMAVVSLVSELASVLLNEAARWDEWLLLVGCVVATSICLDCVLWLFGAPLPRLHLLEIHEQSWCPPVCRKFLQESLRSLWKVSGMYRAVSPILQSLVQPQFQLALTRTIHIVDLCSGGSGPVAIVAKSLQTSMSRHGARVAATLTDLFPHVAAWDRAVVKAKTQGVNLDYSAEPVDATALPKRLAKRGARVRTMFACFHHFEQELATSILADAVSSGSMIAVFEFTNVGCRRAPLARASRTRIPDPQALTHSDLFWLSCSTFSCRYLFR